MTNKVILNYFKKHCVTHSLKELKTKALASGYSKKDVEEVIDILRKKNDKKNVSKACKEDVKITNKGDRKWIRFSGSIGIVFFVLGVLGFVLGLFGVDANSFSSSPSLVSIFVLVLFFILIVLVCFYFYGFFRMGKLADSKLLRVSAIMNIFIIVGFIVLTIASFLFMWYFTYSANSDLRGSGLEGGFITGNAISSSGGIGSMMGLGGILIFSLLPLYIFISRILFSIALVKIGAKVKFAKIAGILGLVVIGSYLFSFGLVIYVIMNPSVIMNFMAVDYFEIILFLYGIVFQMLGLLVLLFESLSLFDASNKFR